MQTKTGSSSDQPSSPDLRPLLTLFAFGGIGLLVWAGLFVAIYRSVSAALAATIGL